MHMTSTVTGLLDDGKTCFDAFRNCFPAGTVFRRAENPPRWKSSTSLEPVKRGPYAGAVGYVDFRGNLDTCIAIRTLILNGQEAIVQAGAGIVADSVPEREYEETLNKARGLFRAIPGRRGRWRRDGARVGAQSAERTSHSAVHGSVYCIH